MSAMNGISFALVQLSTACCSLESSRPGIAEVKAARVAASSAVDLLKDTEVYLSNGIYVVCDEPKGPYVDPANHKIEMPEASPEPVSEEIHIELDIVAELPPLPDLLGDFATIQEEAQAARFEDGLQQLWGTAPQGDTDEMLPGAWADPWRAAFSEARLDTFGRLAYALGYRLLASLAFPTDEEMATWRAGFAQPLPQLPEELAQFDNWDAIDAGDEYSRRLEQLAKDTDNSTNDEVFDAWATAWDADQKNTFARLLVAEAREPRTFTVPTDEEFATWLAQFAPAPEAPAEPAVDPLEVFQGLLDKLEEAGVKESCLKRKNWKKADKAWRDSFLADGPGTIALLEGALTKSVITWEVPEAAPIPKEAF